MIQAPESVSTVIDRMTILRIKIRHRPEAVHLQRERADLGRALCHQLAVGVRMDPALWELQQALQASNQRQWDLEDQIREQTGLVLGAALVDLPAQEQLGHMQYLAELIRALHESNDRRCKLKMAIDKLCGDAAEIKIYAGEV